MSWPTFEVVIFADGSFDPDGAALLEQQTAWTRRVATPSWRMVCGSTAGGGDANEGPNAHARALGAVVRGNPSAPGHSRVPAPVDHTTPADHHKRE